MAQFIQLTLQESVFSQQYQIQIHDSCGNLEFDSHFMHPDIYLYDSKNLRNVTLQDSMEYQNALNFVIGGQATSDPLALQNIRICTKKFLLEVCTMDDSVDSIYVSVDLTPKMCYIDQTGAHQHIDNATEIQIINDQAVECALSDYVKCRNNFIDSCKFIDCFTTQRKTQPSTTNTEQDKDYLFSACVPKQFQESENLNVCYEVAQGNYFIDHFMNDDGGALDEWGGKQMHTFLILIIIISTHEPPFPVPKFCPDCLFPQRDYREMLRQRQDEALEESMNDDSQLGTHHGHNVITAFNIEDPQPLRTPNDNEIHGAGTGSGVAGIASGVGEYFTGLFGGTTDAGNNAAQNAQPQKQKYDKYKLPDLSI
eukprot:403364794